MKSRRKEEGTLPKLCFQSLNLDFSRLGNNKVGIKFPS